MFWLLSDGVYLTGVRHFLSDKPSVMTMVDSENLKKERLMKGIDKV